MSMYKPFDRILADLTDSSEYFGGGPDEIMPAIVRAQSEDGTTKLIIGDSVCRQLFNDLQEQNEDIAIIGSNAAITMSGQYILAKEYLDHHPSATDVFLIVLPASLKQTYSMNLGYTYAVMPFALTDTLYHLDDNTLDIMADTYGRPFLNGLVVKGLHLSAVNRKIYLNYLADHSHSYKLSSPFELADQYVGKIAELCNERGVKFHLYPCPVCESNKDSAEAMSEQFASSKLYEINPDYFDMIDYFSADQSQDGVHFDGNVYDREMFNSIIMEDYKGEVLLDYLKY
ncbi:hypothetical protein [Butyrivibrio sp. MC2013]|uniref:hypothetical protein n=1 Tax=Butyrivibrio sp. MC2013 TaxID=1280686 RepID=UPI0018CB4372|nr:hypothetical protein [Butyrivibrio sp. MC2013]